MTARKMFSVSLTASAVAGVETGTTVVDDGAVESRHQRRSAFGPSPATTFGIVDGLEIAVAGVLALGREAEEEITCRTSGRSPRGSASRRRRWCRDRWSIPAPPAGPCAAIAAIDRAGLLDEGQVGLAVSGQRRGHADDDDVAVGQLAKNRPSPANRPAPHLVATAPLPERPRYRIAPPFNATTFSGSMSKPVTAKPCARNRDRQRQADIAQPDDARTRRLRADLAKQRIEYRIGDVQRPTYGCGGQLMPAGRIQVGAPGRVRQGTASRIGSRYCQNQSAYLALRFAGRHRVAAGRAVDEMNVVAFHRRRHDAGHQRGILPVQAVAANARPASRFRRRFSIFLRTSRRRRSSSSAHRRICGNPNFAKLRAL